MKAFLKVVACFLFGALITGCSAAPSAGDAEKLLTGQIQEQSKGKIKLLSFKKTNGQAAEIAGVKLYTLEYQAEIEFEDHSRWVNGGFKMVEPPPENQSFGPDALTYDLYNPGVTVKKGQHTKLAGFIRFEKTEEGWRQNDAGWKPVGEIEGGSATAATSPAAPKLSAGEARTQCIQNLKSIDAAIQMWALEKRKMNTDKPVIEKDMLQYLRGSNMPVCPAGGAYRLGNTIADKPKCTVPGHQL